jgi:hypothetical protein
MWGELNMPWQALFKILYSDLHTAGEILTGLGLESFSSGQVADPLGKDSNRNPRLRDKQSGEDRGIFWSEFSLKLWCFDPFLTLPQISALNVGDRWVPDVV